MKAEQYQGKVKQYNADKGFGFISSPEGDVFFHISDFPADSGEPKRNERVKFNVVENGDRYKAIKIDRAKINLCILKQRGFLASFLLITIRKIQLNRADYVSKRKNQKL